MGLMGAHSERHQEGIARENDSKVSVRVEIKYLFLGQDIFHPIGSFF